MKINSKTKLANLANVGLNQVATEDIFENKNVSNIHLFSGGRCLFFKVL
jgi:hypothetical protein